MRIQANPDQTFESQKGRTPGLFVKLAYFHSSGSGSAFPIRIRIRMQVWQMNADPGGSGFGFTTLENSMQRRDPSKYSQVR